MSRWKTKESSIDRRTQLVRWSLQLDEIQRDHKVLLSVKKKKKRPHPGDAVHRPGADRASQTLLSAKDRFSINLIHGTELSGKTDIYATELFERHKRVKRA